MRVWSIQKKYWTQAAALIACGIIACGKEPQLSVDGFEPYIERFESEANARGVGVRIQDLIVRFDNLEPKENGRCVQAPGRTPIVLISQEKWAAMNDARREALIAHELGHCVLKLHHDDSLQDNSLIPKSIMHSILLNSSVYVKNRNYYWNELFSAVTADRLGVNSSQERSESSKNEAKPKCNH